MDTAEKTRPLTAEEFLAKDQREFGDAWRYELVDGRILAHAAPTPVHGAIVAGLSAALGTRLRGHAEGCRPEAGSGAAPASRQRGTARIPDAMVRRGELPRVAFEVVSASELKAWRERDRKRVDLQEVEGVREIVEVYQDEMAAHVYRKAADGTWSFEAVGGPDATLRLASVGLEIPLTELYEFALVGGPGRGGAGRASDPLASVLSSFGLDAPCPTAPPRCRRARPIRSVRAAFESRGGRLSRSGANAGFGRAREDHDARRDRDPGRQREPLPRSASLFPIRDLMRQAGFPRLSRKHGGSFP